MADEKLSLRSLLFRPAAEPSTPQEFFSRLPVLETPRLILRRMTMRDAADMYEYARDPEVARHVLWDAHRSVSETRGYLRAVLYQYRNGYPSQWGIVERATGRLIGTIGYMSYQEDNALAEVGYSLARSHWNQGLMTEALNAVIRVSFETLKLHRIEAQHFTANPSSGRVMQKCGMTHEGRMHGRIYNKGKFRDVEMWAILRRTWERQQPSAADS